MAVMAMFPLACSGAVDAGAHADGPPPAHVAATTHPSFPGAVGYGATSKGGAKGRIIAVTTLADSGPGSYRACVTSKGPRVCVFRVNGVIRFSGRPPIVHEPYLTIAGQTAPGDGITLSHAGGPNGRTPLVIKGTHDIVVRHIRVRTDIEGQTREAEDDITIMNSSRVLIDHVSASWARDEVINGFADNDDVTISNSIFAWGIPRHDKCALLASDPVDRQDFSFIGNICAHNGDRNPDLNFPAGSCVEVLNNVFYNAQSEFAELWESEGGTPATLAGNSFIAGPDTHSGSVGIQNDRRYSAGPAAIYLWGNSFDGNFIQISNTARARLVKAPSCTLTVAPKTAQVAYRDALATAGAYPRDALDRQVVREVETRTGRIGAAQRNIPPSMAAAPYPDNDHDGMDDTWERAAGADPEKSDAWQDADGDGVSNLEQFLAYRERKLAP